MSEVGEIPAGYEWSAVGGQAFKASMSAFPTGVTIVTTLDENDSACGLTCNAFMSVSVDPPLIVVSVDKTSQTLPALRRARHFVVNFLAAGREELATLGASKRTDKFTGIAWTPTRHRGLPILHEDSIGHVACEVIDEIDAGDHVLLLGQVYESRPPDPDTVPLLYFRRAFDRWPVGDPSVDAPPSADLANSFATIDEAIEEIRAGKPVVVVDDADRENEGDVTIAAQFATPEAINFMASHARGLICLCLTDERCDELALRPMTEQNEAPFGTAFTVSIEAREGVTTGISAPDRSRTIQVAIDPTKGAADLVQPGHVFPLRARPGGVLQRAGQTEAAVDLARLAGLVPAGVVCEVMKEDGTMARVPDLVRFCARHGLRLISVADLIEYRRGHERLVERGTAVRLPTAFGEFTAVSFRERITGKLHVALVKGDIDGQSDVLVRVHSECVTGDVFHSLRCDCGEQLEIALRRIGSEERGVLLYLSQEGRGIGLLAKLRAYELQEQGLDTVDANLELGYAEDAREYGIGAQILADLGLTTIRILTNNPKKITGIQGFGLRVVGQEPIETQPNAENLRYLQTKRDRMGHALRIHHQGVRFGDDWEDRETAWPSPD